MAYAAQPVAVTHSLLHCFESGAFILSISSSVLPGGADIAHLRNGFKNWRLVAAYLDLSPWIEKKSPSS